jgi:hypothetical protein
MNIPDVNPINAFTALVSAIAAGVSAIIGVIIGHKHGVNTEKKREEARGKK